MSDLKARMAKQLAARTDTPQPAVPPVASIPGPAKSEVFNHRISLDVDDEDYRALKIGSVDERATVAQILRSLVGIWRTDEHTRRQVTARLATIEVHDPARGEQNLTTRKRR